KAPRTPPRLPPGHLFGLSVALACLAHGRAGRGARAKNPGPNSGCLSFRDPLITSLFARLDFLPEVLRGLAIDLLEGLDGPENLGITLEFEVAVEFLEGQPFEWGQVAHLRVGQVEVCQVLALLQPGQAGVGYLCEAEIEVRQALALFEVGQARVAHP